VPGIKSLSWSPTGDPLATGASGPAHPREEESIRVWDSASGSRLAGFVGEFEPVVYLKWHPSGMFFVTSSAKGTGEQGSLVQFLPAPCFVILRLIVLLSLDPASARALAFWQGMNAAEYSSTKSRASDAPARDKPP